MKKAVLMTVIIVTSVILASCEKKNNMNNATSMPNDNGISNQETTVKESSTESVAAVGENSYIDIARYPWRIYYPNDVPNELNKHSAKLFTYDVSNYMVMSECAVSDDIVGYAETIIKQAVLTYKEYCTPQLTGNVKDIEGQFVTVNDLEVYKFTAKILTKGERECYAYGYTWGYTTPDLLLDTGAHKYNNSGKDCQYVIVGVVSAEDQEAYKAEMEELTDYLMYNTQMLD